MKTSSRNIFIILLYFMMSMILYSAAFAEGKDSQFYDTSIITGFEPEEYEKTVNTEYKYALIELEKEFPTQLTVRLGGEAFYQESKDGARILTNVKDYIKESMDVSWKCLENYDEDLDVFHFAPNVGKYYKLAVGLELPVITVNVLGKLPLPPEISISREMEPEISFLDTEEELEEELTEKEVLPSYYNGYEKGLLPPVRDQGQYGTCWAHAAIATVEADLIHDGNATTSIDLSELHLVYFSFHNFRDEKKLNRGDTVKLNGANYLDYADHEGNADLRMTNMIGPIMESKAPYSSISSYSPKPSAGRKGSYMVTGVYYYNIIKNRDSVKKAVMKHGALSADVMIDENYYSPTYNSYYYPPKNGINHAVAVVGWDDNFSRYNFKSGTPAGNGAWLVRNSWGVNGYNLYGYFWISYYDGGLYGNYSIAIAVDAQTKRYDHVYAYDNSPNSAYYSGISTVSQKFPVNKGEEIKAIGFYTEAKNLRVKFTVSAGSTNRTKTITTTAPGYYLVKLKKPLRIPAKTYVTVKYKTLKGSKQAWVEAGKSKEGPIVFNSRHGSPLTKIDGWTIKHDAKIKLFTNDIKAKKVIIKNAAGKNISRKTIRIKTNTYKLVASATPIKFAKQQFSWKSSDTTIATVKAGKVTFKKPGTVKITATAKDGSGKFRWVKLKYRP